MSDELHLGELADEADWRALVEQGLKGARWDKLVGQTSDGIPIQPLYREPDAHTATDVSGFPGAAPFTRGARNGAWRIRQAYANPEPWQANVEILADLEGGVSAVELVVDPTGARGIAIREPRDFDLALSQVMVDIAPVSLDIYSDEPSAWMSPAVKYLDERLKGAGGEGIGFNLDPIGNMMRTGARLPDQNEFKRHVSFINEVAPAAVILRLDARHVHEAGATEAQEIATALCAGIEYLRWMDKELNINDTMGVFGLAVSVGPDVLVETAKLRALRMCWSRVLEASGAKLEKDFATPLHAFTSRRMMTRYDAWTNILRVTTAAFAAGIGGADDITTYPFTDALGLPTPFSRRVARNTQHVLLEECRLGHVADPAGGAWFVEKLTRDLAAKAWEIMQDIERRGGIVSALQSGNLQAMVAEARARRQRAIATRRETITGVTDFPLLGAAMPEFTERLTAPAFASDKVFAPVRWAEPFEALRDKAEAQAKRPAVFFATLGALSAFGARAQFARNLFAAGGVASIGEEEEYASREAMVDAFRAAQTRAAVICGTDATYAEDAENAAQRLKAGGADWVILAGKPGELETRLRAAGVDQFVFTGQNAPEELATLHAALGIGA